MSKKTRLGMLTPSSNTALEPVTAAMIAGLPEVTAHFSRFKVTEIAISESSNQQFDERGILDAAELLSHAKVDVIAWNGTSASWLGFDSDERLCARLTETTGVRACTCVLAFREIFERTNVRRIGLVTPYVEAVQSKIAGNWGRAGFHCVAERHAGLIENFAFAEISNHEIEEMTRGVASADIDAIAVVCTNMGAAPLVERLEAELGVPIYDSIAVTLWKSLCVAGVSPASIKGWGRLFADPRLA